MSAVACYQRNGKTGNLEMLAIDMTAKTDTMQVTDKHRQGTGTGSLSSWENILREGAKKCHALQVRNIFPTRNFSPSPEKALCVYIGNL